MNWKEEEQEGGKSCIMSAGGRDGWGWALAGQMESKDQGSMTGIMIGTREEVFI